MTIREIEPPLISAAVPRAASSFGFSRAWRGLLWSEWFAHSKLLLVFLAVWLIAVWTLPLFTTPGWILLLGGLYALMAGPVYGGGDILEGCEEFTFALPPSRKDRYLSRLLVGAGSLLTLCLMNALALGLDLPQMLARVYVQTGIIKPLPVLKPGLLYGLVVALPFMVFALAFTISALTHSRVLILLSWFWAGLASLAFLQIGFWYENLVWDTLNGYFACPLLLAISCAVLGYGLHQYRQKEIGKPSVPITLPGHWWVWIVLFALGMGLALSLLSSLAKHLPQFVHH